MSTGASRIPLLDLGACEGETEDERTAKRAVALLGLIGTFAVPWWGAFYAVLGVPVAAVGPGLGAVVAAGCLVWLGTRKDLGRTPEAMLAVILVAPATLHLTLGGFEASGAAVLWSLMAPLAAPVLVERRRALPWFGAFAAVLAGLLLAEPWMSARAADLPRSVELGALAANLGVVSAGLFALLYRFVGERDAARDATEALLLDLLPAPIVVRMKSGERTIADRQEEVSVLFADLVGFTPMSATMSPEAAVELLNALYSRFDELVDQFGVEKIHTIGDGYMVAAGIPTPREDHAEALVGLGLALIEVVEGWPEANGKRLGIRIGVNSGPAVAGVIGQRRLQYDVWGDTVNVASRMESHGQPGKVQITQATRDRVDHAYLCEPRGTVEVKGRGPMQTWFAVRER